MNPLWQQKKLREFCKAKDIHITAFSPLGANGTMWGDNRILECDVLEEIAKAHGKTAAQVYMCFLLKNLIFYFKALHHRNVNEVKYFVCVIK